MHESDRDSEGFYVLHRKYSTLYKKVNYTAPVTMVQNRITEYDIHSANLSILRTYRKLKPSTIDDLESLPKHDRQVIIGKLQREDPSIKKVIAKGIIRAKEMLFQENGIQDEDVLSIKNDAVFVIGRKLKKTTFGEFIEFRAKNTFSLYLQLDKIEYYYDKANDQVIIKGIKDSVLEDPDIQAGMMNFFRTIMKYLCYDRRDKVREYLIEFSDAYKKKKLPIQYYKELSGSCVYRTNLIQIGNYSLNLAVATDADREHVLGTYNYRRFVIPFIQAFQ